MLLMNLYGRKGRAGKDFINLNWMEINKKEKKNLFKIISIFLMKILNKVSRHVNNFIPCGENGL